MKTLRRFWWFYLRSAQSRTGGFKDNLHQCHHIRCRSCFLQHALGVTVVPAGTRFLLLTASSSGPRHFCHVCLRKRDITRVTKSRLQLPLPSTSAKMSKVNSAAAAAPSSQSLLALLEDALASTSRTSSTSFHTSTTSLTSQTHEEVQEILRKDPGATEAMVFKVNEYITSNKVVMFGKPGCSFCVKAKNVSLCGLHITLNTPFLGHLSNLSRPFDIFLRKLDRVLWCINMSDIKISWFWKFYSLLL